MKTLKKLKIVYETDRHFKTKTDDGFTLNVPKRAYFKRQGEFILLRETDLIKIQKSNESFLSLMFKTDPEARPPERKVKTFKKHTWQTPEHRQAMTAEQLRHLIKNRPRPQAQGAASGAVTKGTDPFKTNNAARQAGIRQATFAVIERSPPAEGSGIGLLCNE